MSRKIVFFEPNRPVSQSDLVATVEKVLFSEQTHTISVDERLWSKLSNAISDAEAELGIILNTYEEEWIEGKDNLRKFKDICQKAIGNDNSIDPFLIEIVEMIDRLIKKQMPLIIHT